MKLHKKIVCFCSALFLLSSAAMAFAEPAETKIFDVDPAMLGHWYNETGGAKVGVVLKDQGACELYVSRFPKPESRQDCKFEPYEGSYLIFIVKENGECGSSADFEFTYRASMGEVGLLIGSNEIILTKEASSPLPTNTGV